MVQFMNLNELMVGPVGLWSKDQAVGNAQRCPRFDPVRRRRMVHKSTGRAPLARELRYGVCPLNSFTMGKELGWRDIDWHRPAHRIERNTPDRLTENFPTPAPSVD